METGLLFEDPAQANRWCARQRAAGRSIGLVPTMGALHAGHLSLVRRAVAENDCAVVSVFVNPLQFDEAEDLERYPRDLATDRDLVAGAGCRMVFSGSLADFFPEAAQPSGSLEAIMARIPKRPVGPAGDGLEGEFRRGHFEGVATIVGRLFHLTQPARAYFGAKDFQQTLVVRELVAADRARGLSVPEIVVCATDREADGLARSSRNTRLNAHERRCATALSRALFGARALWRRGERDPDRLAAFLGAALGVEGVHKEYAEVRDPEHWGAERPAILAGRARALVAARVGPVRLIDNLALDEDSVRAEEGDRAWDEAPLEPDPSYLDRFAREMGGNST